MNHKKLQMWCIILYPLTILVFFCLMASELHSQKDNPIAAVIVMFIGLMVSPISFVCGYGFIYYFFRNLF